MGRVEWVTFHKPCSQESVGGVTVGMPAGAGEDEVEGWRRVICGVFEAGAGLGCSRGAGVSTADAIAWRYSTIFQVERRLRYGSRSACVLVRSCEKL